MRSRVAALFLGVALAIAGSSSAQLGGASGGLKGAAPGAPRPITCHTIGGACSIAGMVVGQVAIIEKPLDTSRASTITRTVDPDLQFSNAPSGTYISMLEVDVESTNGNWRFEIVAPSNLHQHRLFHECGNSTTSVRWSALATIQCVAGVGGSGFNAIGRIFTGGGLIELRWAQDTSNATATTVGNQSYWILVRTS